MRCRVGTLHPLLLDNKLHQNDAADSRPKVQCVLDESEGLVPQPLPALGSKVTRRPRGGACSGRHDKEGELRSCSGVAAPAVAAAADERCVLCEGEGPPAGMWWPVSCQAARPQAQDCWPGSHCVLWRCVYRYGGVLRLEVEESRGSMAWRLCVGSLAIRKDQVSVRKVRLPRALFSRLVDWSSTRVGTVGDVVDCRRNSRVGLDGRFFHHSD